MSDIYVRRAYEGREKHPGRKLFFVLVVILILGGLWWWLDQAHRDGDDTEEVVETRTGQLAPIATTSRPNSSRNTASRPKPTRESSTQRTPSSASQLKAEALFDQARSLVAAGKLADASKLLDQVVETTSDSHLKNNAVRVQGRVNVQLFFSGRPSADKKNYVIQPGDSLDRIARRNSTTVELIRKMNQIDGNLIYPGARLSMPSAPFVVQVDKSAKELDLVLNGKLFKRYSVGLGRFGKTPLGTFKTVVHQQNPDWTPPSGGIVPFGDPQNVLGTRWMSIVDASQPELKGFGIHGTADRTSIGGETSNGCVRMLNEDVEEVFMLIPRGTTVIIHE